MTIIRTRELTEEGEGLKAEFESKYSNGGCACHINPPCEYCIHPGNPDNLEESDDLWIDTETEV